MQHWQYANYPPAPTPTSPTRRRQDEVEVALALLAPVAQDPISTEFYDAGTEFYDASSYAFTVLSKAQSDLQDRLEEAESRTAELQAKSAEDKASVVKLTRQLDEEVTRRDQVMAEKQLLERQLQDLSDGTAPLGSPGGRGGGARARVAAPDDDDRASQDLAQEADRAKEGLFRMASLFNRLEHPTTKEPLCAKPMTTYGAEELSRICQNALPVISEVFNGPEEAASSSTARPKEAASSSTARPKEAASSSTAHPKGDAAAAAEGNDTESVNASSSTKKVLKTKAHYVLDEGIWRRQATSLTSTDAR